MPTKYQLLPGDVGRIMLLARINGTDNMQHLLPVYNWKWPESTWLQRRLALVRSNPIDDAMDDDWRGTEEQDN